MKNEGQPYFEKKGKNWIFLNYAWSLMIKSDSYDYFLSINSSLRTLKNIVSSFYVDSCEFATPTIQQLTNYSLNAHSTHFWLFIRNLPKKNIFRQNMSLCFQGDLWEFGNGTSQQNITFFSLSVVIAKTCCPWEMSFER